MVEKKEFTIYKASAGAGKTFTLAIRFIELLIKNPAAYQQTLAVTFTNKATEEMKMRILAQLYGLWKGLKGSESYMNKIKDDLGVAESHISKQAGVALSLILHDYSNFQVQTIDAFFQRVLRNLAHELELTANLRVELNDKEVEIKAVDNIINSLTEHNNVLRWLVGYVEEKMNDDKSWDVITSIKKFGNNIFKQQYKMHAQELNQCFDTKGFFENYRKEVKEIRDNADKLMKQYGEEFDRKLSAAGYTYNDFSNKTAGACGYFIKLKKGEYSEKDAPFGKRAQSAAEGPEGWVGKKKGIESTPIYAFASDVLVPYINKVETDRQNVQKNAASAKVILTNLNELRLLYDIREEVQRINQEENTFLLSDTQDILYSLMKDSDAPFVFEKIGSRLKNIMIDEFQDTSIVQWKNFSKLIKECLSQSESENLVVGDIKQSIYRWRDGDWQLLKNLPEADFLKGRQLEEVHLEYNFRSERKIVDFNNAFFTTAAPIVQKHLEEQANENAKLITELYNEEDIHQNMPQHKTTDKGLVDILLLESEHYEERCVEEVIERIKTLDEQGESESDIAIIVRDKTNIANLAEQLQQLMPEHRFVSEEAFKLNASTAVRVLMDTIRLIISPDDHLVQTTIEKCIGKKLPEEIVAKREELKRLSLTDLMNHLIHLYNLENYANEGAYINALLDYVAQFAANNIPDHQSLINYYDETMQEKAVQGGKIEGIRIITIHKSKGLEYKHVIIPFCDWTLDLGNMLWCTTNVEPFGKLPVLPVNSLSLKGTIYSEDYQMEQLQNSVDNLNLLYVAFTRARQGLYVIGRNSKTKNGISTSKRSGLIQEVLPELNTMLKGSVYSEEEDIHFVWGQSETATKEEKKALEEQNVFEMTSTPLTIPIVADYGTVEFRQSNDSKRFVNDEEQGEEFIDEGIVMHDVLSRIETIEDIDYVLNQLEHDGVLTSKGAKLIRQRLLENQNTEVERWFAKDIKVFNECSIILANPETGLTMQKRPDRVVFDGETVTVIDFKFGTEKEEHKHQVGYYMKLLRQMGYKTVEGYLWYVYQNKIKEV